MKTVHSIAQALQKQITGKKATPAGNSIQILFGRVMQNMRNLGSVAVKGRNTPSKKGNFLFGNGRVKSKMKTNPQGIIASGLVPHESQKLGDHDKKQTRIQKNKNVTQSAEKTNPQKIEAKGSKVLSQNDPIQLADKIKDQILQAMQKGSAEVTHTMAGEKEVAVAIRMRKEKLTVLIQAPDRESGRKMEKLVTKLIDKVNKEVLPDVGGKIKFSVVRTKVSAEHLPTNKREQRSSLPKVENQNMANFGDEKNNAIAQPNKKAPHIVVKPQNLKTEKSAVQEPKQSATKSQPQETTSAKEAFREKVLATGQNKEYSHQPAVRQASRQSLQENTLRQAAPQQNVREEGHKKEHADVKETVQKPDSMLKGMMKKGQWQVPKVKPDTGDAKMTSSHQTERSGRQEKPVHGPEQQKNQPDVNTASSEEPQNEKSVAQENQRNHEPKLKPSTQQQLSSLSAKGAQTTATQHQPEMPAFARKVETLLMQYARQQAAQTKQAVFKLQESPFGRLEIHFDQHKKGKEVTILVESEQMKTALQKHIPQIQQNISAKGAEFLNMSVDIGAFTGGSEQAKNERQNNKNLSSRSIKQEEKYHEDDHAPVKVRKFGYNTMEILA